jgi:undecaprenyl-diphosphatase
MFESLIALDTQLFLFFNVTVANPFFDVFMPFITNKWTWLPVWLVTITVLIWKGGKGGRYVILLAILAVACSDLVSHRIVKKSVKRIRPNNAIEQVHLTVKGTKSYSMPSNHASNFFALATVFSFFYRRYRYLFYSIAFIVAFSRISVGVHYPFDALIGALLGSMLAGLIIYIFVKSRFFEKNYIKLRR